MQVWIESFPEILCLGGIFPKLTSLVEIISLNTILSEPQLGQISCGKSFSLKFFFYTRYFSKLLISPWIFWTNTSLERAFLRNTLSWQYFSKINLTYRNNFLLNCPFWSAVGTNILWKRNFSEILSLHKIFFQTVHFAMAFLHKFLHKTVSAGFFSSFYFAQGPRDSGSTGCCCKGISARAILGRCYAKATWSSWHGSGGTCPSSQPPAADVLWQYSMWWLTFPSNNPTSVNAGIIN